MKTLLFAFLLFVGAPLTVYAQDQYAPSGRNLNAPPETAQLDFFIGTWEVRVLNQDPGTPPIGRSHAYYVMDGFAIQDEWRSLGPNGNVTFRGVSLRSYDVVNKNWSITWSMINLSGHTIIEAKMEEGELVSTGKGIDHQGLAFLERYRYYDIHKEGFKFEMERSYDDGTTWQPVNNMHFSRAE